MSNREQSNGVQPYGGFNGSQRVYQGMYANGGQRGIYGNMNDPYGARQRYGGYQQPQRWPHDEEDEQEKEEMQRLMVNLRKIVLPQIEQVIAYIVIPMIGGWIFKMLKVRQPALPSTPNISFCRLCKLPVDYWVHPFVKS
mmetsp:Transcript_4887/g.8349  ORF Transcript_4887/g.8349 Transcript_4887/m.8349 type:complete len:140 (+) Transcript_4887:112-531(+)